MTTTHTNLALVEGEVYILGMQMKIEKQELPRIHKVSEQFMLINNNYTSIILASTAKLEGIPQLDRKHFVKPKVNPITIHNAKEAEFTEQDLIEAMYSAAEYPNKRTPEETFSEFVKNYLNKLRPLSLPKSITLNENNEVISVEW